jgi:hypothetical protein
MGPTVIGPNIRYQRSICTILSTVYGAASTVCCCGDGLRHSTSGFNFTPGAWQSVFNHGGAQWDGRFYVEFAQALERACFDYIMLEDTLMVSEAYRGTAEATLKYALQVQPLPSESKGGEETVSGVKAACCGGCEPQQDGRDRDAPAREHARSSAEEALTADIRICWCGGAPSSGGTNSRTNLRTRICGSGARRTGSNSARSEVIDQWPTPCRGNIAKSPAEPMVRRLSAGAKGIRTLGPASGTSCCIWP